MPCGHPCHKKKHQEIMFPPPGPWAGRRLHHRTTRSCLENVTGSFSGHHLLQIPIRCRKGDGEQTERWVAQRLTLPTGCSEESGWPGGGTWPRWGLRCGLGSCTSPGHGHPQPGAAHLRVLAPPPPLADGLI